MSSSTESAPGNPLARARPSQIAASFALTGLETMSQRMTVSEQVFGFVAFCCAPERKPGYGMRCRRVET